MDAPRSTDLLAALRAVPDPRRRRGRRHPWPLLLALVAAALASGERNLRAVGQWVTGHADGLVAVPDPPRRRLPSVATPRRAPRIADLAALERCLAALAVEAPSAEGAAG